MRKYSAENRERLRAQAAARQATPGQRRNRSERHARERQNEPKKYRARDAVHYQVRAGHLKKKPCIRCGAALAHAHHPDYTRPLKIIWLCDSCHKIEHGRLKQQATEAAA